MRGTSLTLLAWPPRCGAAVRVAVARDQQRGGGRRRRRPAQPAVRGSGAQRGGRHGPVYGLPAIAAQLRCAGWDPIAPPVPCCRRCRRPPPGRAAWWCRRCGRPRRRSRRPTCRWLPGDACPLFEDAMSCCLLLACSMLCGAFCSPLCLHRPRLTSLRQDPRFSTCTVPLLVYPSWRDNFFHIFKGGRLRGGSRSGQGWAGGAAGAAAQGQVLSRGPAALFKTAVHSPG